MSMHLTAQSDAYAETVLLPGDPQRAKYMAEQFLSQCECVNELRGMLGYTGYFGEKKISIQSTGMGIPSSSIYIRELIQNYGAKTLIRLGTCGSTKSSIKLGDIVFALSAGSDSSINNAQLQGIQYAPCASYHLLSKAVDYAKKHNFSMHSGQVISTDSFYDEGEPRWIQWEKFGILAVDMETYALYSLASRYGIDALSILSVSDCLSSEEAMSSQDRITKFRQMFEVALNII